MDIEIFFIKFLLIITTILLLDYLLTGKRKSMISNIPGPKSIPLVGSFLPFLKARNVEDLLKISKDYFDKYGKTYKLWIGARLSIVTYDVKDIEAILGSNKVISKSIIYNILRDWLGDGLLISTGRKWFSRRKILTPSFHFKILEQFIPIFNQQSTILVEKLQKYDDGKTEFDVQPFITLMALDMIAESAMGTKLKAQSNPDCEYVLAVKELSKVISDRFVSIVFRNKIVFALFRPKENRRENEATKIIHEYTKNIITTRRKLLETSSYSSVAVEDIRKIRTDDDIGVKVKTNFLDVLLRSTTINGKPLTDSEIQEEVDTFLFEGHDTVTSCVSFTLYLISRHQTVQRQIFDEIREVLGEDNTAMNVGYRELNELKYLECVIKESLRLYPPISFIARQTDEETTLNGKRLPAGTNIFMQLDELMRDPDLFDEPNEFKPERHFISDVKETSQQEPYAFVPFSAGPRNCIGQKFAMLEMKSVISKVLRHYELLPMGPAVQHVNMITLKSRTGFHLGIKKRIS